MRVNELYSAVCKLGFESTLEDIPAFFYAANRAMLQINAIRPVTAILEIYHRAITNLVDGADHNIHEHLNSDVIFSSSTPAKAYYFEVLGEGECSIEVYDPKNGWVMVTTPITFNTKVYKTYHGFINPEEELSENPVRLRFMGQYIYQIRNAALYGQLYSSSPDDIPKFREYVRYDLRKLAEGFIELADNPFVSSYTRINDDYIFEDNAVLLMPSDVAREVKIKYKKAPGELVYRDDPAADDSEIELDPELAQLLPLLTAVYVLADEGDGKSEYYHQLYRERAAEIEARKRSREGAHYANVTGW